MELNMVSDILSKFVISDLKLTLFINYLISWKKSKYIQAELAHSDKETHVGFLPKSNIMLIG